MEKATQEITAGKLGQLTEAQKDVARSAMVAAGIIAPRLKKVRIPKRFEDISLKWVKQAPFFSEFMLRFHFFKTKDIPTAGVNVIRGNLNFYFNPEFINGGGERPKIGPDGHPELVVGKDGKPVLNAQGNVQHIMVPHEALTDSELEGLLVHEIMHIIRLHHERTLEDYQLFNIAADMLINDDIKTMQINHRNLDLPKGGVYFEMVTNPTQRPGMPKIDPYKGEKITEPLYIWLMDVRQQFQDAIQSLIQQQEGNQGQGQQDCHECGGDGNEKDDNGNETGNTCPNCGGSGKEPGQEQSGDQPGGDLFNALYGSNIDVHALQQQSDELSEATIKEIIESAKMRGWGKVSGNAVQKLENLLKPAKLPWRQILRKAISPLIHDYGPYYESTWSRRNRRGLPLPGLKKLSNKIVVAIDTSGSISLNELGQFFSEIEKICRDVSQLVVLQWDTRIANVDMKYKKGDWKHIQLRGRGGTAVQCVYDWMKKNEMQKYPLVNFTDGWFDYDFQTYGVKTIWCVTQSDSTVPHGRNVYIDLSD